MSIFLISDLHFNHAKIIQYCHRPFSSVKEMNMVLVKNWNQAVGENDVVFCVGDLGNSLKWLNILNGNIALARGTHDRAGQPFFILHHKGIRFLIIHDPADAPKDWDGWIIHGHLHNNSPIQYPFINQEKKTINVSVEMINYTPIKLDVIEAAIEMQGRLDVLIHQLPKARSR